MLQLKIDTKPIEDAKAELEKRLAQLPNLFRSAVQNAAADERMHHKYQNQTGRLENSTKGRLVRANKKLVKAELVMSMPYASYVRAKGLTDINQSAADVEHFLDSAIEKLFAGL